jgi:hypothetical protein
MELIKCNGAVGCRCDLWIHARPLILFVITSLRRSIEIEWCALTYQKGKSNECHFFMQSNGNKFSFVCAQLTIDVDLIVCPLGNGIPPNDAN